MGVRVVDRIAERAQRRDRRLIGRGGDEERVDGLDWRAGELGGIAGVQAEVAGVVDRKVAVAVIQTPGVTTVGDVDREDPLRTAGEPRIGLDGRRADNVWPS